MELIPIKDLLYTLSIVVAVVVTFYTTKHNLKDYIRDKLEECNHKVSTNKDMIANQNVEIEKLKTSLEYQKQILDQFQKQILPHLPDIFMLIGERRQNGSK
jgi:hypothetical protein